MRTSLDLTGQRFGRLTVLHRHPENAQSGNVRWLVECDCGAVAIKIGSHLRTGLTKSCGCLNKELISVRGRLAGESCWMLGKGWNTKTHGEGSKGWITPEYRAWLNMKTRCYNSNQKSYKDYGGRGITVCGRWLNSFENFLADMGRRPSRWHSLDRIDPDGPYSPENCRWATRLEQNRNQQRHKKVAK